MPSGASLSQAIAATILALSFGGVSAMDFSNAYKATHGLFTMKPILR